MKDLVYSLLALLYPHGLFQKFAYYLNVILSYKIASKLGSCGNGTRFSKVEFSMGLSKICVGSNTVFLPHLFLTAWGDNKKIRIGDNCSIGAYCHISAANTINIGNNVLIGKWVSIVDNNHGWTDYKTLSLPPMKREIVSKGPINIGDNVWIGDKVTISQVSI